MGGEHPLLEPSLLPPRNCINRKQESEAEMINGLGQSNVACGHLKYWAQISAPHLDFEECLGQYWN